jgi:hypothetical protein
MGVPHGILRVFNTILYENEFQNNFPTDHQSFSRAFYFSLLCCIMFNFAIFNFSKVATKSDREKVRYVKFDALGHHLVTGIANLNNLGHHHSNYNYMTLAQQRAMARSRRYRNRMEAASASGPAAASEPQLYIGINRVGVASERNSPPTYGRYFSIRGHQLPQGKTGIKHGRSIYRKYIFQKI